MSIHLERGAKNAVAFVFSCPGQKEQQRGRPAAGPTGKNLKEVLCVMRGYSYDDTENLECGDWTRENIWITNAWSRVEYEGLTGRSEATIPEILETENISRLAIELGVIENVIVCCGDKAQMAVCCLYSRESLQNTVSIVSLRHLGGRALNGWIPNRNLPAHMQNPLGANDAEIKRLRRIRRRERLRRWADFLYREITAEQNNP